jgi:hypothetical protein
VLVNVLKQLQLRQVCGQLLLVLVSVAMQGGSAAEVSEAAERTTERQTEETSPNMNLQSLCWPTAVFASEK